MILCFRRLWASLWFGVAATASATALAADAIPASYVNEIASQYQLDPHWVQSQLAQAEKLDAVITRITTPWEAKPWYQYQAIFLKPERVAEGVAFWKQHQAALQQAQQRYGVPAEFIVAILGVETYFGRFKGTDPVLDSLYTLAFHYPARGSFFRAELGQFLALVHEQGWDSKTVLGSYAGAMGYSQFISSSYRAYAVDFDGDGQRDLIHSAVDAIGSIANYFAQHGWQSEGCLVEAVTVPASANALVQSDTQLRYRWSDYAAAGIQTQLQQAADSKALLFPLEESAQHSQHYLACNNFYVITRYNHSRLYAMAVYRLSQWLKDEYSKS